MSLTKSEESNLKQKKNLYREALKKSAYLTYMLMRVDAQEIKNVLAVYLKYTEFSKTAKAKYGTSYSKIDNVPT